MKNKKDSGKQKPWYTKMFKAVEINQAQHGLMMKIENRWRKNRHENGLELQREEILCLYPNTIFA